MSSTGFGFAGIFALISKYGYIVLFLALFFENTVFLGLIVPGETVLFAAAAFASTGKLSLSLVIVIGVLAAILGNVGGYLIGRFGGRPFIERFGHKLGLDKRIKQSESYFDSHGGKTVLIGRFAAGIRVFVAALAGAAHMNFVRFLSFTVIAVILWTLLVSVLGFYFGENWELISKIFKGGGWVVLLIIGIGFIIYYLIRRKK